MEQVQHTRLSPARRLGQRWCRFALVLVALAVFTALNPSVSSAASSCYATGKFLEKLCEVDATDEAGVTIAVQPGVDYRLQVYMGSWQAHSWGGPLYYHGWVTNGSDPNWYRMATGIDSNDVDQHWAYRGGVELLGDYYAMEWRATTSSIRFRVADAPGKFYDNSGKLYLWLSPPQ